MQAPLLLRHLRPLRQGLSITSILNAERYVPKADPEVEDRFALIDKRNTCGHTLYWLAPTVIGRRHNPSRAGHVVQSTPMASGLSTQAWTASATTASKQSKVQ
jgi:hypothetical protein